MRALVTGGAGFIGSNLVDLLLDEGHAVAGFDVIFHLAAGVGNTRSIEHPRRDSEVNILGTLSVLEAARSAGIERIVLTSSAGIFGELSLSSCAAS